MLGQCAHARTTTVGIISYIVEVEFGIVFVFFVFIVFLNLSFELCISDIYNMYANCKCVHTKNTHCKCVHTKNVDFKRSSNQPIHIVFSVGVC